MLMKGSAPVHADASSLPSDDVGRFEAAVTALGLSAGTAEPFGIAAPIEVKNPYRPSRQELAELQSAVDKDGFVVVQGPESWKRPTHPLRALGRRLQVWGTELKDKAVGSENLDGTSKIISRSSDHRLITMSDRAMEAHQDGLAVHGTVTLTGLWTDAAPATAAITYVVNILDRALSLRESDHGLFEAMFDPGAVVVTRKSDRGVFTAPAMQIRHGHPLIHYRTPDSEYDVSHVSSSPRATELLDWLYDASRPQSIGTKGVRLDRIGKAIFFNNHVCVHGRTAFIDGEQQSQKRKIASAWWSCNETDAAAPWGA